MDSLRLVSLILDVEEAVTRRGAGESSWPDERVAQRRQSVPRRRDAG